MATLTKPAGSAGGIRATHPLSGVTKGALAVLLIAGAVQLGLGLVIWGGEADQLILPHIILGTVVVLSLWTIAAVAARSGVSIGLVAAAVVWGLIAPIFGLTHDSLLQGDWHWAMQVVHVFIGVGVVACGLALAASIRWASR